MQRDRVDFAVSGSFLGESVGLEMPRYGGQGKAKAGERQTLLEMQSAACSFFEKLLQHPQHGAAHENIWKIAVSMPKSFQAFRSALRRSVGCIAARQMDESFCRSSFSSVDRSKKREQGKGYYDTFRNRADVSDSR